MPDDGAAIPAGLKRILADSFVLRFMAQAASWRLGPETGGGAAALIERLVTLLDGTAQDCAVRMRVLGDTPPNSIGELLRLSSCRPVEGVESGAGLPELAHATLQVARDFSTMGIIARESGDEATAHFLFSRIGSIEEAVWSIGRLGASLEGRSRDFADRGT